MEEIPQTPTSEPKRSNRGGRPKLADKDRKRNAVKVYFDDRNFKLLKRRSSRTGLPLSALVHDLAVNGYVKEPIPKSLLQPLRDIAGMANNINQLAHRAHLVGYEYSHEQLSKIASDLENLIIKISGV